MSFDDCYECGETGHLARDCPARLAAIENSAPKPPWCGGCDQQTRLVYGITHNRDVTIRCVKCHPLGHVLLKQHRKCACGQIAYSWDHSPCGKHQALAV